MTTCNLFGLVAGTEILSEEGLLPIESLSKGVSLRTFDPTNGVEVASRRVEAIETSRSCELWALRLRKGSSIASSYSVIVCSSSLMFWLAGFADGIEEFYEGSVSVFPDPARWINVCDLQTVLVEGSTPLLALAGGEVTQVLSADKLLRTDNPCCGALDDSSLENGLVTIVSVGVGPSRWLGASHLMDSHDRPNLARNAADELLPFFAPVHAIRINRTGAFSIGEFAVLASTSAEG